MCVMKTFEDCSKRSCPHQILKRCECIQMLILSCYFTEQNSLNRLRNYLYLSDQPSFLYNVWKFSKKQFTSISLYVTYVCKCIQISEISNRLDSGNFRHTFGCCSMWSFNFCYQIVYICWGNDKTFMKCQTWHNFRVTDHNKSIGCTHCFRLLLKRVARYES